MKLATFLIGCLFILTPILGHAQIKSEIHMYDGHVKTGDLILIGEDYILFKESGNLVSISRDSIKYYVNPITRDAKKSRTPRISLSPISKRFTSEVDAGITVAMPFALRMGYTRWANVGRHWQLGLGTSMQFYRYTMFSGHTSIRYNIGQSKFYKPFFEGGFGLSYLSYVNGLNFRSTTQVSQFPFGYRADFKPIKQVLFGPGVYLDTGLGVAFTSKLLYNATWYKLNENPSPSFEIRGEYFFSSASLLFGFIF